MRSSACEEKALLGSAWRLQQTHEVPRSLAGSSQERLPQYSFCWRARALNDRSQEAPETPGHKATGLLGAAARAGRLAQAGCGPGAGGCGLGREAPLKEPRARLGRRAAWGRGATTAASTAALRPPRLLSVCPGVSPASFPPLGPQPGAAP